MNTRMQNETETFTAANKRLGSVVYKDQAHLDEARMEYRRLVDEWNLEFPNEKLPI